MKREFSYFGLSPRLSRRIWLAATLVLPRAFKRSITSVSSEREAFFLFGLFGIGGIPRRAARKSLRRSSRTSPSAPIRGSGLVICPLLPLVCLPQADHSYAFTSVAPCKHAKATVNRCHRDVTSLGIIVAYIFDGQGDFPIDRCDVSKIEASFIERPAPLFWELYT